MSEQTSPRLAECAVVTGAAGGIGAAIAQALSAAGVGQVVLADLDAAAAGAVAATLPGNVAALQADVAQPGAIAGLIERVENEFGPIDLWCGNAGVLRGAGLGDPQDWQLSWAVHVQAQVAAVDALLPRMIARGGGRIVMVASAAGLLTSFDSAAYAVSKHATVALAEWVAITHADDNITVHCVCPQAVRTAMTTDADDLLAITGELLEPRAVAESLLKAIAENRFLVLPHPEVAEYEQRRVADRDRWIAAMAKLRRKLPSQLDR